MKKRNIFISWLAWVSFIFFILGAYIYWTYIGAIRLHNLWNSFYELSQERQDMQQIYLESALESYSWSLSLQEHIDTRFNYDFVKELLKEQNEQDEKQQQDDWKNQDQEKSESWWEEQEQSSEESQQQEWKDEQSWEKQQWWTAERGENYQLQESQDIGEMSQQEERLLEETLERLEKEQIYNQRFFNKKDQELWDPFDEIRKRFFGEINTGGEKDW